MSESLYYAIEMSFDVLQSPEFDPQVIKVSVITASEREQRPDHAERLTFSVDSHKQTQIFMRFCEDAEKQKEAEALIARHSPFEDLKTIAQADRPSPGLKR